MKPERWQQIDQVLEAALERDSSERAAFLDQACAGDSELRQEVESLLAHDSAESFVGGKSQFTRLPITGMLSTYQVCGHRPTAQNFGTRSKLFRGALPPRHNL